MNCIKVTGFCVILLKQNDLQYPMVLSFLVQIREKSLKAMEEEVHRLRVSTDNKIDKYVLENLH